MSEVDEQEINKVIAEFMGWSEDATTAVPTNEGSETIIIGKNEIPTKFTRSLDVLIPAWEKLNCFPVFDKMGTMYSCEMVKDWSGGMHFDNAVSESIQLAAATATYKAIKALEGREK